MQELALIAHIARARQTRNPAVRLGIGDDCAILRPEPGEEFVVTTDFSLEGRHFRRDWHSPESAGHRCLARGLSDVAAMGGRPLAAFLSLALPRGFAMEWVDGFLRGFGELSARFGVELAGGDTSESAGDEIAADIVCVGAVPAGRAMLRSGGRPGDWLYCTGELGGAAVELDRLATGGACARAAGPGRAGSFPTPRIEAGLELMRNGWASACLDLSDGLSTDLGHLCSASRCGAQLESEALPLAPGATLAQALHGGEDYELLFASAAALPAELAGVKLTRIGRLIDGTGVMLDGEPLQPGGWEHFRA